MSCESPYEMCVKKRKKNGLFKEGRKVSEYLAQQVIFKLRKSRIVGFQRFCDFIYSALCGTFPNLVSTGVKGDARGLEDHLCPRMVFVFIKGQQD